MQRLSVTVAAATIIVASSLGACANGDVATDPPATTVPSTTPTTAKASTAARRSSPSVTPSPSAEDRPERVTSHFVTAWLDSNPKRRAAGLKATAIPHLAELLINTDPAKIPEGKPAGVPVRVSLPAGERPEQSADAIRFEQALSNKDVSTIQIDLIPLPERDDGWAVAAVTPKE